MYEINKTTSERAFELKFANTEIIKQIFENKGVYSLYLLKKILKIAPITEKLSISLKTDYPLKIIFELLEGGGVLDFYTASAAESALELDDMEEEF